MKKALIFFFSGTGNTWWLAKTLGLYFEELGVEIKVVNIEYMDISLDTIGEFDVVGLGYPVYGSDCPINFLEFVENLPFQEGMNCFIFTAMLGFSGDGALTTEMLLKEKGYNLRQAVNVRMLNNIKLPYPGLAQFPIYSEKEGKKIREDAKEKAKKLASKVVSGEKWIEGRGILNKIGGLSQRVPVSYLGWTRWAKNFFVDYDTCTGCMQCVENCPADNISMKEGKIEWGKQCICCVRCYNLCPTDAIQYKEATMNRKKFPRFKGPTPGFHISHMKD